MGQNPSHSLWASVREQLEKDLKETISDHLQKWLMQNEIAGKDSELLNEAVGKVSEDVCQSATFKKVTKRILNNLPQLMKSPGSAGHSSNGIRTHSRLSHFSAHSSVNPSADDFVTVDQLLEATSWLEFKDTISKARALNLIGSSSSVDYLSRDNVWFIVSKSLNRVLDDPEHSIRKTALKVYTKLLTSSQSRVVRNAYCSLLEYMRYHFYLKYKAKTSSHLTSVNDDNMLVYVAILCSLFQRAIPKHWLRYPKQDITDIVYNTFKFFSYDNHEVMFVELWALWSKIDNEGGWLRNWLYSSLGRSQVMKCVKEFPLMICRIVKWCLDNSATKNENQMSSSNSQNNNFSDEKKYPALFLYFVNIIGLLLEYNTGRQIVSSLLSSHSSLNWLQFLHTLMEHTFHNGSHSQFQCIVKVITHLCTMLCVIDGQASTEEAVFQAMIDIISYPLNVYFNHPVGCKENDISKVHQVVKSLSNLMHYDKGRRVVMLPNSENEDCLGIPLLKHGMSRICDCTMYDYSSRILMDDLLRFCTNFLHCPCNMPLITSCRLSEVFSRCIQNLNSSASDASDSTHQPRIEFILTLLESSLGVGVLEDANRLVQWMPVVLKASGVHDKTTNYLQSSKCLIVLLSNLTSAMHLVNTRSLEYLATIVWKSILKYIQQMMRTLSDSEDEMIMTAYKKISVLYSFPGSLFIIQESLKESSICNSLLLLPKSLFPYVESSFNDSHLQIIGLHVLCTLVSCLKTNLYLQSNTYALDFLTNHIKGCITDDGTQIIDELSVLSNHCIVKMLSVGGSDERVIPPKSAEADGCYDWPFATSRVLPDVYTKSLQHPAINIKEPLYKILTMMGVDHDTMVESLELLDDDDASLDDNDMQMRVFLILEKIVKADVSPTELPHMYYETEEASDEEENGIWLTLCYSMILNITPSGIDAFKSPENALHWLLSEVRANIYQEDILDTFDFFAATVFLLSKCNAQRSWVFLEHFSTLDVALFIWPNMLLSLSTPSKPVVARSMLSQYFDILLKDVVPLVYNAFQMTSYPPFLIFEQWIRQCFWNYLNWSEICLYLLLCVIKGGDYALYFCIAIMKHLEQRALEKARTGELVTFFKEEPITPFKTLDYLDLMNSLASQYRDMIMRDFMKYLTMESL